MRIAPRGSATWPDAFIKAEFDRIPIVAICAGKKIIGTIYIVPLVADATNDWLIDCCQPSTQGDNNDMGTHQFVTGAESGFKTGLWSFRVT